MEHWFVSDIQQRREELHAQAARVRLLRQLESGRSTGLRGRIADNAETLSVMLAGLARVMRNHQA